jgi:hypothetical protein
VWAVKKLYKYDESFGRMGELSGVFVADHRDVDRLMDCGTGEE